MPTGWLCHTPAVLASQSSGTEGQRGADPQAPIPTETLHMRGLAGGDTGLAAAETLAAVPPGGRHRVRSQGCSPCPSNWRPGLCILSRCRENENCAAVSPDKGPSRTLRDPASSLRGQGGSTGARWWLSPAQIPQWLLEALVSSSESCLTLGPRWPVSGQHRGVWPWEAGGQVSGHRTDSTSRGGTAGISLSVLPKCSLCPIKGGPSGRVPLQDTAPAVHTAPEVA